MCVFVFSPLVPPQNTFQRRETNFGEPNLFLGSELTYNPEPTSFSATSSQLRPDVGGKAYRAGKEEEMN